MSIETLITLIKITITRIYIAPFMRPKEALHSWLSTYKTETSNYTCVSAGETKLGKVAGCCEQAQFEEFLNSDEVLRYRVRCGKW